MYLFPFTCGQTSGIESQKCSGWRRAALRNVGMLALLQEGPTATPGYTSSCQPMAAFSLSWWSCNGMSVRLYLTDCSLPFLQSHPLVELRGRNCFISFSLRLPGFETKDLLGYLSMTSWRVSSPVSHSFFSLVNYLPFKIRSRQYLSRNFLFPPPLGRINLFPFEPPTGPCL